LARGEYEFVTLFNTLDGAGRPESNGAATPGGRPRRVFPDNFNRSSAPDANACSGCHTTPRIGGGGDDVSNAFVLANARDFADSIDANTGNERNPPSLFGSGAIDMLGREMTTDLQAMKNTAVQAARLARLPITLPLYSKGVSFGWITVLTREGPGPRLERMADGRAIIRAFTDLKRHRMGSLLNNERLVQEGVPTDAFITRKLWGIASEPPFLHNGRATTFTEAILAHGGEAQAARDAFAALTASDRNCVVEFLKSLRVLPAGATALIVYEFGRPR
jgi:hypothetical protein